MAGILQLGIFLTHEVVPGTFPSSLKTALGKQSIYLQVYRVRICITRNLFQKNRKFPLFFCNVCQFSVVYMDILLVKALFFWKLGLCTRLKQTGLNCQLSLTHIWPQNMLCSFNTVIFFKTLYDTTFLNSFLLFYITFVRSNEVSHKGFL